MRASGIKSWDRELYLRLTGRQLEPTPAFARRPAELGKEVWVRFVLVPGLTDATENVAGAASLGNVSRVDVLPFHRLGAAKWEQLGMESSPSPRPRRRRPSRSPGPVASSPTAA
ncbi:hypothetical protein [Streptomyces rhizosphaerihabitans]|uniref:hypothetical protein n=1 Tax=Streptomyces rhizosphaerihabitans TaxID=1266770 RepID=UPI0028F6FC70|nr:hypothetical protein [Streptomyces rhizosphaerihabitans]